MHTSASAEKIHIPNHHTTKQITFKMAINISKYIF